MEHLNKRHSRLQGAQLLEDGFGFQKAKANSNANMRISNGACYNQLLRGHVLDQKHSFSQLSVDSQQMPRTVEMANVAYKQSPADHWELARAIMSTKQSTDWYSLGANDDNEWVGNHFTNRALRLASLAGPALSQARANLETTAALMSGPRLLVRDTSTTGPWLFVAGSLSATCYVGWPSVQGSFADGSLWFEFGAHKSRSLYPLVMVKEKDWEAIPYMWGSPYRQWCLHMHEEVTTGSNNVIRALPTSQAEPLRTVAARAAFYSLPRPWLVKYSEYLSLEVNKDDQAFDIVWKLVQSILGCSDEETLKICSQRAYRQSNKSNEHERNELSKAMDSLTKGEKQELKNATEEMETEENARLSFKESYLAKKEELKKLAASRQQSTKRKSKVGEPSALERLQRLKVLSMVPADSISQQQASRMTPPGAHVWNGWKQGSWHGHLPPYTRISAPWATWGHRNAILHILKTLWSWWLEDEGLPTSACPVQGLFD